MESTSGGARSEPAGRVPGRIRPGATGDARRVAQLHADEIAEGFLSSLGTGFLELLYRRIMRTSGSFLVVAEEDGSVVGFLAGSCDVGALYRRFVFHDGIRAVARAWRRLLVAWPRAVETLRHSADEGAPDGSAELLSIAVDPAWRGRHVASNLVGAFHAEVRRRELPAGHVVVAADNAPAVGLYQRAGFVPASRFELHPGTVSLLMTWTPPAVSSTGSGDTDGPAPGQPPR